LIKKANRRWKSALALHFHGLTGRRFADAFGGDFTMDQSAAGGHPLHVAWPNRALMTLIVIVIDAALDDIGHGLDPSVWVFAENTAREPILH